jgi:hypothetical protein
LESWNPFSITKKERELEASSVARKAIQNTGK